MNPLAFCCLFSSNHAALLACVSVVLSFPVPDHSILYCPSPAQSHCFCCCVSAGKGVWVQWWGEAVLKESPARCKLALEQVPDGHDQPYLGPPPKPPVHGPRTELKYIMLSSLSLRKWQSTICASPLLWRQQLLRTGCSLAAIRQALPFSYM